VKKKVGKPKKKKVAKGKCSWRNNMGFLGSCGVSPERRAMGVAEPNVNDMYAVYTTTQGGDSKDLSWVDGVTILPAEGDNVLSFMLLTIFLRYHQDLSFDVDLQDGRIHKLSGFGLDFVVPQNQVLLVEDIQKINEVRMAISRGFYTKEKAKVGDEDRDKGLDFTGFQGRRDDEIVPQVAASAEATTMLSDLIKVIREAGNRFDTIPQAEWNARYILRKPNIQTIDMHRMSSQKDREGNPDESFVLFEPLTDLVQVKRDAEQWEQEEEMRKRQAEESKRREKAESQQRKTMDKKSRKQEEMRIKQEEQRAVAQAKKAAKAAGKGMTKAQKAEAARFEAEAWAANNEGKGEQPEGKGKSGKGKGKAEPKAKAKAKDKKSKKGEKGGGKDGGKGGGKGDGVSYGYELPNVPPPWVAVPDANTGRFYYWNQQSNEVSWTPPVGSSPTSRPAADPAGNMLSMQQQQQQMAMYQQMMMQQQMMHQ